MKILLRWWRGHGTKMLGSIGTAIPALLAIDGLVPKNDVKYWLAAAVLIGLLTVHRGVENGKTQRERIRASTETPVSRQDER